MQAIIRKNTKLAACQLQTLKYLECTVSHMGSLYGQNNYSKRNYSQFNNNSSKTNQKYTNSILISGGAVSLGLIWNQFQNKQQAQAEEQQQPQQQQSQEDQQPTSNIIDQKIEEQAEQQQQNNNSSSLNADDLSKSVHSADTQNQEGQINQDQNQDENQGEESIMKEISRENLREIMNSTENKLIYFYRPSKFSQEEYNSVEEHATKMFNGLRIQPYKLDLDQHFTDFADFLKERNPATVDAVEKQINDNTFLLANQYDDIWFWELDLIRYFYGDLLEQIFNFYQGPQKLISDEQIIMNQSTENEFHIVVYIDSYNNKESIKKIKNYRKYHTKNTDKFFHIKYWITEDKELAKKLKINTNPDNEGDIYLLRKASNFNNKQKNINLCGYDYYSERILTSEEIARDIQNSYAKILQFAFNSPIQVHDYMTFASLQHKFKTNMFVVYCDKKKDPKQYDEILRALIKARKNMPINLKPDEHGQLQKTQRQSDVVFVLSSTKNLMPLTKLHADHPQGLFITPEDNFVDLFNVYLPQLEKIEDLPPQEFLKKAFNNDKEFQHKPTDDDKEQNKKDTMKLIYSPDRFIMSKMYSTEDINTLTNFEKMVEFVKQAVNGELKYYWDTEQVPKTKYAQKVVGEDFDKRILQSTRDALVFVYHPIKEKNRSLMQLYEEFVRNQDTQHGFSKDGQLVYAKYNGINESQQFKSPQKLPQILYFKKVENQDEKDVIALDNIEDLMVKQTTQSDLQQRLKEFIKKNQKL